VKNIFSQLFSNKQRIKIIIAVVVLVVLSSITLYITLSELGIHWPTEKRIEEKKHELKQQRRKLRKSIERAKELLKREQVLEQISKQFWEEKKDTHIDSDMRASIEKCAKSAEFELQSMGNIRKSKLSKGLNKLAISISANSPMDKVVHFLNNIRQAKPGFFWQQCSIRPDNLTNPSKVYINGTLSIISINRAEIKQLLNQETK
jgi:hypothetical protein